MNKWIRRLRPAWLLATLVMAALACSLPGGSEPTPIPVSSEEAGGLVATLTSITPGPNGETTITITQEQLTSYVALELQKMPDAPVTDPQIVLDDGKIKMTGNVNLNGVGAPGVLEMEASATPGGDPKINILSAQVGPLDVPQNVLESVSELVVAALKEQIAAQAGGDFKLESLTIDNGVLTATGTIPPS